MEAGIIEACTAALRLHSRLLGVMQCAATLLQRISATPEGASAIVAKVPWGALVLDPLKNILCFV